MWWQAGTVAEDRLVTRARARDKTINTSGSCLPLRGYWVEWSRIHGTGQARRCESRLTPRTDSSDYTAEATLTEPAFPLHVVSLVPAVPEGRVRTLQRDGDANI